MTWPGSAGPLAGIGATLVLVGVGVLRRRRCDLRRLVVSRAAAPLSRRWERGARLFWSCWWLCSAPGPLRAQAQAGGCPEPNDEPTAACPLGDGTTVQATLDRQGDVDVYRVTAGDDTSMVQVDLTNLPADYASTCSTRPGGMVGQSVHEGTARGTAERATGHVLRRRAAARGPSILDSPYPLRWRSSEAAPASLPRLLHHRHPSRSLPSTPGRRPPRAGLGQFRRPPERTPGELE